jgi:hypothetical protein
MQACQRPHILWIMANNSSWTIGQMGIELVPSATLIPS